MGQQAMGQICLPPPVFESTVLWEHSFAQSLGIVGGCFHAAVAEWL